MAEMGEEKKEQEPAQEQPSAEPSAKEQTVREKQERTWAMLCHLAALSALVTGFGFIVGPLVVWLIKKDEFPLVDENGKEALNFQLSVLIYGAVAFVLCFVLIGFVLLPALLIFDLVMVVIASVKASKGEKVHYPLTLRFIK